MKRFAIALLCLGLGIQGYAQSPVTTQVPADAQTTKILRFKDAIKIALQNAILLNQQKNNLEYNQIQKLSNIAGLGPTLSGNLSAGRVDGNTFNQQEGKVINGIFDQLTGSLSANLTLFNGFSQVNRARSASSLVDAQSYYVNRTTQDVINTVALQYMQVLLDGELLLIATENQAVLEKQLGQIKEQVALGSRSPVEEYNQNSQAKGAEIVSYTAQINLINDRALLTQTLLLDPTDEFDVTKPGWDVNTISLDNVDLNALLDVSLKSRGDYLRAVKTEEGAKYSMYAAKATMLPSVSAYYQIYSAYNHAHGDPNVRDFDIQFKQDNLKKFYGAQVYIPIFGGNQNFQIRSNYVQQKVLYHNSQILRKNSEITVKTDVLKAYKTFDIVRKIYAATIEQLKSAEIAFQYESERYNLGVTDFVAYLNANRVLVQAQTDKARAEYRLVFQKILLDYAAGTLKPEDLTE